MNEARGILLLTKTYGNNSAAPSPINWTLWKVSVDNSPDTQLRRKGHEEDLNSETDCLHGTSA